jgi:hypothetical protein
MSKNQETMKKVILGLFLLMVAIASTAQTPTLIEDGFQTNGSMNIYWESEDPNDMANADQGAKWHLEKQKGIVTFWIDLPQPQLKQLSKTSWKEAALFMIVTNGMKMYVVRDNQFRHLTIAEYEKGKYMVQLCSILEQ